MKKLIVLSLFIPFFAKAQFVIVNTSTTSLIEPRTGKWPLDLQRVIKESDTCYVLAFRDQQENEEVNMSTLKFGDLTQLKYFQQGLSALKSNSTGSTAKFKDYSIKRMDVKKLGEKGTVWYVLTCSDGSSTNFQQPEADRMIAAIKSL
ncbi:MAG TPA: hypothetical protein VHE54_16800 [Puia sp.]|nr:hypothetical protein [Puia sp.]